MEKLAEFAKTQPQAAYAAYIHGEQHRFSYFLRTIPVMEDLLQPLDDIINNKLIPALTGNEVVSPEDRDLYSLPLRLGGLGLPILSEKASEDFHHSTTLTAPLAAIMVLQGNSLPDPDEVKNIRTDLNQRKNTLLKHKADLIQQILPQATQRAVDQAREKGASNWLGVLPLEDQGFTLNKGEFRDALAIRYNKRIRGLPSQCPCGQRYDLNHALNCKRGGFVIMRHNNIRDFEANLMRLVCNDVETEPPLQPLQGEKTGGLTGDEARPDIRARGIWRNGQNAFFDVRVTNLNCSSQNDQPAKKIYAKHEAEKKRAYNERVMQVEHGSFTPLIYSVNGGVGPECDRYHKHLAERIAAKTGEPYGQVMAWIRCKIAFIILRACLICVRGSRSHTTTRNATTVDSDFNLACDNARIR